MKWLLYILLICSSSLFGQSNKQSDSLIKTIININDVKSKIEKYIDVSFALRLIDPNASIRIANDGIKFSVTNMDKRGEAMLTGNIAVGYQYLGNYKNALFYGLRSLKLKEAFKDTQLIAIAINNIALVYDEMKNYKLSLFNFHKALGLLNKGRDKKTIASIQNNIGNIYYATIKYDSALYYFNKALETYNEVNDENGKAMVYTNVAGIFFDNGNFNKAIENDLKALNIRENSKDIYEIASSLNNLGFDYNSKNLPDKSIEYHLKAIEVIKNHGSKLHLRTAYQGISEAYSKSKNYKLASEYMQKYIDLYKSMLNDENSLQINEMQTKFDTEKKDIDNKLLQAKNMISNETIKQQKIVTYFIIGGLLIVSILAFNIFSGLKKQRKANTIISEQKLIVEHQKELVEEKHKEITDSINYAERIQRSFLASKELLIENLNEYFVFFQPKDVVSGDFYWASKLANGNFALVTADSTGHGVPGAIMSILNISSLEKAVAQNICEPSEIFNYTRKVIVERLKKDGSSEGGKDGMDASLISLDKEKKRLSYTAANNPIWIVRKNNMRVCDTNIELIELSPDKMPVGKHDRDSISFTQHNLDLQIGDVIYTLTDGLPDQFGGPKGKKFMYKKLKDILMSISQLPMSEQKDLLSSELKKWKGDLEQVDDVCIVGIRI